MIEIRKLLTSAEVAALFRVDPKTIARWDEAGRFTQHGIHVFRTLGNHRRYDADSVYRYLNGQAGGRP